MGNKLRDVVSKCRPISQGAQPVNFIPEKEVNRFSRTRLYYIQRLSSRLV
jgi:hypothetical protein